MRMRAVGRAMVLISLVVVPLWLAMAPVSLGIEPPEEGWYGLPSWDEEALDIPYVYVPDVRDLVPDIDAILEAAGLPEETPVEVVPEPEQSLDPPPYPEQPDDPSPATAGRYLLCGDPDSLTERAIEQLIAGRSFSSRLVSRADGCAELTITVSPQSSPGSFTGRQSVGLTVTAGSGSGASRRPISVRVTTENGTTRASIGAAR